MRLKNLTEEKMRTTVKRVEQLRQQVIQTKDKGVIAWDEAHKRRLEKQGKKIDIVVI